MTDVKRTPTQHLVLDVLAARYRLGEHMWTFPTSCKSAINFLTEQGLVGQMHGVIEHTLRAWLTDAGKKAVLSDSYVPPLLEGFMIEWGVRYDKKTCEAFLWGEAHDGYVVKHSTRKSAEFAIKNIRKIGGVVELVCRQPDQDWQFVAT